MQITDRSKDVIKSGGEWISSIEIENLAMGHPQVCVVAATHVTYPHTNICVWYKACKRTCVWY